MIMIILIIINIILNLPRVAARSPRTPPSRWSPATRPCWRSQASTRPIDNIDVYTYMYGRGKLIHVYTYIYTYTCMCIYIYIYTHMYMYVYIYITLYIYIYIYEYMITYYSLCYWLSCIILVVAI